MKQQRHGDSEDRYFFRTKRLFNTNGEWFFDTREGTQCGPFHDRDIAEKELAIFIAQKINDLREDTAACLDEHPGIQDGIALMVEEFCSYFKRQRKNGKISTLAWAKNRIQELKDDRKNPGSNRIRQEALKYVMDRE